MATIIQPKNDKYVFPRIGVAVVVLTVKGFVLLKRSPDKHGGLKWSLPGGAQELGETLVETARREVMEEIGVTLDNIRVIPMVTEDIFKEEGMHWTTFYFRATTTEEPRNLEPEKHVDMFLGWADSLPKPFFVGIEALAQRDLLPYYYDTSFAW